jgi:hypothetical protein
VRHSCQSYAGGAAVAAALTVAGCAGGSGVTTLSEPPIRVRTGSFDVEAEHATASWRNLGKSVRWQLADVDVRQNPRFRVNVTLNKAEACTSNPPDADADAITFVYTDKARFTFTVDGQRTTVRHVDGPAQRKLENPKRQLLNYPLLADGKPDPDDKGFIKEITSRGPGPQINCVFEEETDLAHVILTDPPPK